ncbi:hypothetical protein GGX14DRAFT_394347 [Mycena pura]|uniref:Uncharacterized protein n=1 Tax=Mycena pura TaxID=153505 RepID=A0AAD6VI80_9AGAR|nr:hypothetical protein GGX14DRAFT_394347 [Mycena pura]
MHGHIQINPRDNMDASIGIWIAGYADRRWRYVPSGCPCSTCVCMRIVVSGTWGCRRLAGGQAIPKQLLIQTLHLAQPLAVVELGEARAPPLRVHSYSLRMVGRTCAARVWVKPARRETKKKGARKGKKLNAVAAGICARSASARMKSPACGVSRKLHNTSGWEQAHHRFFTTHGRPAAPCPWVSGAGCPSLVKTGIVGREMGGKNNPRVSHSLKPAVTSDPLMGAPAVPLDASPPPLSGSVTYISAT